jgi:hypothetical protein
MAQSSFPWEDVSTSETQYSQLFRQLNNGVNGTPDTDDLEVGPAFTGLAVDVEAGEAMVLGHYYISTAVETLALATANPTNPRIDTVVLRLDPTADSIVLAVKTGTPAGSPVAPTLTQTLPYGLYEFPLANVLVPATAGTPSTITDRREFMGTRLGSWTTAGRPTPDGRPLFGFNLTTQKTEIYNTVASAWQDITPASLNDIGDVTITSATTGQILEWNGTAWVNGQVDAAGIASDAVTTAKILNANVTRAKLASGLAAFTAQETITATGVTTWTVPSLGNNPWARVTVIGGGGGGGGGNEGTGGTGGTTTFDAGGALTVSASGGVGGINGNNTATGPTGTAGNASGNGGCGGTEDVSSGNRQSGSNGMGGGKAVRYFDLSGISTVTVTVGAGGTGGGTAPGNGGPGGRGEVIIE